MKLHITVGKETTDDEIKLIRATFGKKFDIQIDNTCMRLSETELLPLVIYFTIKTVASGAVWDGIKFAVQSFFAKKPELTKRPANIKITTKEKYAVISDKRIIVQEREKAIEIKSMDVDELIKYLREDVDK